MIVGRQMSRLLAGRCVDIKNWLSFDKFGQIESFFSVFVKRPSGSGRFVDGSRVNKLGRVWRATPRSVRAKCCRQKQPCLRHASRQFMSVQQQQRKHDKPGVDVRPGQRALSRLLPRWLAHLRLMRG